MHTISNGILEASAVTRGAELVSVRFDGKERLWQGDDRWRSHAPVLFPYCGKTTVVFEGRKYPVLQHGFARYREFVLVEKSGKSMTFLLSDSEETKKYYPFAFDFYITYELDGNALIVKQRVKNTDGRAIYFGVGGHESFLLGYSLGQYGIEFEKEESFDSRIYADGLTNKSIHLGAGKFFPLSESVLSNSETVIFAGINSRRAALVDPTGKKVNEFAFEGYGNLLLWRPVDANMICFEPWQNLPDSSFAEPPEFSAVKGINELESGKEKEFIREIKYF